MFLSVCVCVNVYMCVCRCVSICVYVFVYHMMCIGVCMCVYYMCISVFCLCSYVHNNVVEIREQLTCRIQFFSPMVKAPETELRSSHLLASSFSQ